MGFLTLLLLGVVALICWAYCSWWKQEQARQFKAKQQALEITFNTQKLELEEEYKYYKQKVYYEQREKILQEEGDALKAQAQTNYQEYFNSLIAKANTEAQIRINELTQVEAQAVEESKARCEALASQEKNLISEIAELTRQKDIVIEALKQEEAVKRARDFYSIQLTEDDLADIIIIENLSAQIRKRAPLRKLIWSEYYARSFGEMADRILGKTKHCGIYKITEIETGRVYIGQSTDVRTRWSNHLKTIVGTDGGAARTRFHDYVAKVGIDKFTFELLEDCPKEQLNEREKFFIEFYHANDWGFNSTAGNKG